MKIIREASVFVVGRQVVDTGAVDKFLEATEYDGPPLDYSPYDCENLVEIGGRLCYRSFGKGRPHKDYIEHILQVGHGSVIEHSVWTLLIIGISRTLTHELVRHRAGISPSQESQRYVDASDVAFVLPSALRKAVDVYLANQEQPIATSVDMVDWIAGQIWVKGCERDQEDYQELANYLQQEAPTDLPATERRKWARQAARSVLPGCAESRICLTGNARAWRNLIELRASRHAEPEIRMLAVKILQLLQKEAPNLFGDYILNALPDGTYEAITQYRKV